MTREQLEHIIRAAGAIVQSNEIVIVGSQAILGSFTDAPRELLVSVEADTYPLDDPSKADLIDGSIGEKSPFHERFGYYAHGVGPETAILPQCWSERLVLICNENTNGIKGLCLHPSDLFVAKLLAGRPKDISYIRAMLKYELVELEAVLGLCEELPSDQAKRVRELTGRW